MVLAEDAEAHGRGLARRELHGEVGAARVRRDVDRTHVGVGSEPEPHDACGGEARHRHDPRVVGVEHRDIRGELGDHLGLGPDGLLDAAELAGVGEAHLQHDADVGRAIRTSRAISPTADAPISATRNRVSAASSSIVIGRAHLVVERGPCRDRRADALEHGAQQVLRRGLAVRSRDADDAEVAGRPDARHDLGRERAERVDRVGDDDLRHGELEHVLDHEQGGTLLRGHRGEPVAVVELAALGEEHVAGGDLARVGRDGAGHDRVGRGIRAVEVQRAADRRGDLGEGERDHAPQPASRSACFASSLAEYGIFTPFTSW